MKKKVLSVIIAFVFCAAAMSAATVQPALAQGTEYCETIVEEQWEEAQNSRYVLVSAVQYTGLMPLYCDSSWNGGYFYSDMTEDELTIIVNCCAENGEDPSENLGVSILRVQCRIAFNLYDEN